MTDNQYIGRVRELRAICARLESLEAACKRDQYDGLGSSGRERELIQQVESARIEASWAKHQDLHDCETK